MIVLRGEKSCIDCNSIGPYSELSCTQTSDVNMDFETGIEFIETVTLDLYIQYMGQS